MGSQRSSTKRRLRAAVARLYRPPVLAGCAILLGALIAAPHVVRLSRELARQPIYLVEGGDVRISRPHEFVDAGFFREALDSARLTPPLSVVDPMLVPRLRRSLEAEPWVAEVSHLSATLQDGVRVVLKYREPALMVRTADGLFPVDADGVVLPAEDFTPETAAAFPTLRLFDAHPHAAGARWRDERVLEAAAVVRTLRPFGGERTLWDRAGFREVRPVEVGEGLELLTAGGSRVVWGRADSDGTVEPSTDQKIGKIESLLRQRETLDAPAGPYRIELRRWDYIAVEPIGGAVR